MLYFDTYSLLKKKILNSKQGLKKIVEINELEVSSKIQVCTKTV